MSALQEQAVRMIGSLSDDNIVYVIQYMRGLKADSQESAAKQKKRTENGLSLGEAAGGLHKYANRRLQSQEKGAWRKAAVKKYEAK